MSHHATRFVCTAALVLLACQDASRSVAPEFDAVAPAFARAPAPPEGIAVAAPLFGLAAAPDGSLLAAISSAGLVDIRAGTSELIAALPEANGVAAVGRSNAYVVTGSPDPTLAKLYRVSRGKVREIADLFAFEQAVNPDQVWHTGAGAVESNPFKVATLKGGHVLVADAAANDVLLVKANGAVDWVAVLTPNGGREPVPTGIAVGPDGAYYVGELTGAPATPGFSRIWRIAPGSRHVLCPSASCTLVAGGFTSIMDMTFGPDGRLYVVEFDEAGWLAVEMNGFAPTAAGGTVSRCNVSTGSCSVLASGLSLPTAIAIDRKGRVWIAEHAPILFAGARVRQLQ